MDTEPKTLEGWGITAWGDLQHYFVDGRSLCGRKQYMPSVAGNWWTWRGKCKTCVKLLAKRERRVRC